MSRPRIPLPAQPVLSIISARWDAFWPGLRDRLTGMFGPIEFESEPMSFDHTEYYNPEFGTPITRRFLAFERLVAFEELPEIKLETNRIEEALARRDGRRICNLDPGMLSLERLVLATCKNLPQRIYLGRGVFADLTLIYHRKGWRRLFWTFPDYASDEMKNLLTELRRRYHQKLKQLEKTETGS